jgi:hypothetical protein
MFPEPVSISNQGRTSCIQRFAWSRPLSSPPEDPSRRRATPAAARSSETAPQCSRALDTHAIALQKIQSTANSKINLLPVAMQWGGSQPTTMCSHGGWKLSGEKSQRRSPRALRGASNNTFYRSLGRLRAYLGGPVEVEVRYSPRRQFLHTTKEFSLSPTMARGTGSMRGYGANESMATLVL